VNLATWYLRLRYPRHRFGPGFRGPLDLRIRGRGRVSFGRDVLIRNTSGKTAILTFGAEAAIEIGDGVEIDGAGLMAAARITVDAGAVLGPCLLVDTDFHPADPARRQRGGSPERRPIRIGSRAWIQGKATILKGVTVGQGALVRWGSVVASDVPPGAVVLGNPATVVGSTVPG
jgi:acetyltransferase-like isoleucine patch superfamily enzyme